MNSHKLGVLLFALLFVALVLSAVVCLLAYVGHASTSEGMQSVAAGFGIFVVLIPMVAVIATPVCFIVIFLAFRSRRR